MASTRQEYIEIRLQNMQNICNKKHAKPWNSAIAFAKRRWGQRKVLSWMTLEIDYHLSTSHLGRTSRNSWVWGKMTEHIIASIPNLPDPESAVIEVTLVSDLFVWASNTTQSVERGHVATPVPHKFSFKSRDVRKRDDMMKKWQRMTTWHRAESRVELDDRWVEGPGPWLAARKQLER